MRDCFLKYLENPSGENDKLIQKVSALKNAWIEDRDRINAKTWRNNVMFYSGNHYARENNSSSNIYRVRLKENHLNNTVSRLLSIVVQNMPIVRAFPASDNSTDVDDAKNTEMYMKYFWRTKRLDDKFAKFVKYALIFGDAFIYRTWNPDLGGKMVLGGDEVEGGEKKVSMYRGDPEVFVDDPFKVAVRPGIEDFNDMYDIIRSVPVSKSMLEEKYGEIEAEPVTTYSSFSGKMKQDEDNVILHSYFHKPTSWFEEGCLVQWVGNKILKARVSTEAEVELPFAHLGFDKIPLRFWSQSNVEQVIDLNEQLNRAASMIIEARNLVARPRVIVSNEAKVPAQTITDRPGDILRYAQAGGKPEFVVPNFNFTELANHKADLRNAISQVSGITSASRGEVPAATRTALALQLVMENDRSQFLPFIKSFHQAILDASRGVLSEAAANITEDDPRVIKIEGKDSTTRTFHGGMIPSQLDLYLEDTNPLGWTAAGRIENIMELAKAGVVKDRNQLLEMLKLTSADPAFEIENINRQNQKKENALLDAGEFVEIGSQDDDTLHMEEIVKIMASFEYKSKPNEVKRAFEAHAQAHQERLNAAMNMGAPGGDSGGIKSGGINPEQAASQAQMPMPGDNMNELLTSSRSG